MSINDFSHFIETHDRMTFVKDEGGAKVGIASVGRAGIFEWKWFRGDTVAEAIRKAMVA